MSLQNVNHFSDQSMYSVTSWWPRDTKWQWRFGSTLAQVMACWLLVQSHYLNQCWLISKVQRNLSGDNFTRDTLAINHWSYLENYFSLKSHSNIPGANELLPSRGLYDKEMSWVQYDSTQNWSMVVMGMILRCNVYSFVVCLYPGFGFIGRSMMTS